MIFEPYSFFRTSMGSPIRAIIRLGRKNKVGGVIVSCRLLRFGRQNKVDPAHNKVDYYFKNL
jgi:hypothetical protein